MYAAALTLGLLASLVASASQEANEILELNTFDPRQTFTAPPECRTDGGVHIIAGSGANNPPHGYGGLASTVDMLRAAFPGTSNYSVGYVKTGDINRLNAAVAQGVEMMKANIAWYAAGCPNTPIVLLGYSEVDLNLSLVTLSDPNRSSGWYGRHEYTLRPIQWEPTVRNAAEQLVHEEQ